MLSRSDWSRPLPRALSVARMSEVTTLADVRHLIDRQLPVAHRDMPHWRSVARALADAASGGDVTKVEVALWIAAALEGLSCRPISRPSLRKIIPRERGAVSQGGELVAHHAASGVEPEVAGRSVATATDADSGLS